MQQMLEQNKRYKYEIILAFRDDIIAKLCTEGQSQVSEMLGMPQSQVSQVSKLLRATSKATISQTFLVTAPEPKIVQSLSEYIHIPTTIVPLDTAEALLVQSIIDGKDMIRLVNFISKQEV